MLEAIVMMAVLGCGVLYLVCPLVKARIDRQIQQATLWQPQQIATDPEGYLAWDLSRLDDLDVDLRGRKIALRVQDRQYGRQCQFSQRVRDERREVLRRLKQPYRVGELSATWPVSVVDGGFEQGLGRADVSWLILGVNARIAEHQEDLARYDAALRQARQQLAQADAAATQLRKRRSVLARKLEAVRLDVDHRWCGRDPRSGRCYYGSARRAAAAAVHHPDCRRAASAIGRRWRREPRRHVSSTT